MSFEIQVISGAPLTGIDDLHEVAERFLSQIGYLPDRIDPKSGAKTVRESIPYRLFVECFLLSGREETFPIGKVTVYVPTRIENLPEETIMGREILNRLTINMNGKKLRVHYAEK